MISPCRERSKIRSPIFHCLPRIMRETNTPDDLFEVHANVEYALRLRERSDMRFACDPQRRKPGGSRYFFRE